MIHFPFVAVVGLEPAKKSLLYHAIDPRLGGTLLLGHRGCAKSTLVRAFAELLGDAPFVELPLGATEDRLLGSVDAESLVESGRWRSRRGLIEEAHGGVLYVDEINLLPDHLADFLLDSAATGQHRVEREGVSRAVESRYILIGTMNPEEGDLRPQLADRFAHGIRIVDDFTAEERMEIVARRMRFDDDPAAFVGEFTEASAMLRMRVAEARRGIRRVTISQKLRAAVAATGRELKLEGLRTELAVLRTARCAAAWEQRAAVSEEDLREAWELCLGHRRESPPAAPPPPRLPEPPAKGDARTEMTPPAPLGAKSEPRPLVRASHAEPALERWFAEARTGAAEARSGAVRITRSGRIAWVASLLASLPTRVLEQRKTWRLRYFTPPRPATWIFLDASRSTGAGQFLARVCAVLGALAERERKGRFNLLLLQHGALRWAARRSSSAGVRKSLRAVTEAGGKSLIVEGLRKIQRASGASGGTVLICSDGLAAPTQTGGDTFAALRRALQRLTRTGGEIGWLHPRTKRALASWVPRLCARLPIKRFPVRST